MDALSAELEPGWTGHLSSTGSPADVRRIRKVRTSIASKEVDVVRHCIVELFCRVLLDNCYDSRWLR